MKKKKKLKIVLLSVGIPVAIVAVAVIAVVWYISARLYTGSVPIVKRQDVYVAPTIPENTLKLHEYSGEILTDEEGNQYYTDETGEHPGMTAEEAAAEKDAEKAEAEAQPTETEETGEAEETEETENTEPEITQPETFPITTTPSSSSSSSSSLDTVIQSGSYKMYLYDEYQELDNPIPIYKKEQRDPDILNIMLLGRDALDAKRERGRTDAMIILSYNKVKKTAKLISLQRDMLIPIEGYDWNRINTPYTFGGVGLTLNTLNDIFDLDLQYYVLVDFSGVVNLINKIGGIDVMLSQAEVDYYNTSSIYSYVVGLNHMDGFNALSHAQNRSVGNSDFSRPRRQREVLLAAYNKIKSTTNIAELASLIDYALTQLSTNIPLTDLMSLAGTALSESGIDISTSAMPYEGTHETVWYQKKMVSQIDIAENTRILHEEIWGAE